MDLLQLFASFFISTPHEYQSPLPTSYTNESTHRPQLSFNDVVSSVPTVMGVSSEQTPVSPTPTNSPPLAPTETLTPTSPRINSVKKNYRIALLGDSMIDTLGKTAPDLVSSLKTKFPNYTFTIDNYGYGSTTIDDASNRLLNKTTYEGITRPAIVDSKPDILVFESFAYNPLSLPLDQGLDHQWQVFTRLVDLVKEKSPQTNIVIAATIGPNSENFASHAFPAPYSPGQKIEHVHAIHSYLQNAIKFAQAAHLPLANAYTPSLVTDTHGDPKYISPTDGIHYSASGIKLMSNKIAEAITTFDLVK